MDNKMLSKIDVLEKQFQEVKRLISKGAIERARKILEHINKDISESSSEIRYMRARMYEEGLFRKVDLDAAIEDFTTLMYGKDDFVREGIVGRARILYRKDKAKNSDEVLALCMESLKFESNAMAMMIVAAVYDDTKNDVKSAKKWAFRAFTNRSPWGLRYYAMMLYRRKKYISWLMCEIAVLITNPFMLVRYKMRGPFK